MTLFPGRSLTLRLLAGVALPMLALAVALGLGGSLLIGAIVGSVNDRVLDAAARGIADSLTVEDGEIALQLSPTVFGMLENAARDNVYYSVRQGERPLTGYADLPRVPTMPVGDEAAFADARYLAQDVRIAAHVRLLPGFAEPVVVEVAETLDARRADTERLLAGLAALEGALVLLTVLLVPLSVRWGLRPLRSVRRELDQRTDTDLTPVGLAGVPAELRDLVRAFNAVLDRLGATLAASRRFVADASHQMRTPLSILRTHVAVLRTAPAGSEEATQSVDDIERGSVRLAGLLGQLLALARADDPAVDAPTELVDLGELVAAVAADLRELAAARGVSLHPVAPAAPVLVRTSPTPLFELLSNLVDNAIRHGGSGGVVRVGATDAPSAWVEDEGPGIPMDDRQAVFGRFVRLRRGPGHEGSGLGLSIAHALAEGLGARVELVDGTGRTGLRAVVRLPPELKAR